ncbi:hypothetical protein TNCV_1277471 [Trichonephila clavipes]|nr:hypothetical protein TNCV_1277471 [Trichonephila clavipes]
MSESLLVGSEDVARRRGYRNQVHVVDPYTMVDLYSNPQTPGLLHWLPGVRFSSFSLLLCSIARNYGICDPAFLRDSESSLYNLHTLQVGRSGRIQILVMGLLNSPFFVLILTVLTLPSEP